MAEQTNSKESMIKDISQLTKQLSNSNSELFFSLDKVGKSIEPIAEKIIDIYKKADFIGTTLIMGGILSILLTFISITPFVEAGIQETIAITILASLFIISGSLLFAFMNNLQFKAYATGQDAYLKTIELISKNQERQIKALEAYIQGLKEITPIEVAGVAPPDTPKFIPKPPQ